MRRAFHAIAICLCPWPASGAAQVDEYWRALAADTAYAEVLVAPTPASIPAPIANGLRLFRAYELGDDEGAARRARELLRTTDPALGYEAWHALALAIVYARGPDSRLRIGAGDYVIDPNSLGSARSLRLLREALVLRPGFRAAALELARWALDRQRRPIAAEADRVLETLPEDAALLSTRAALALLLDQPGQAASLAERAEAVGADPSVARHTRAWALLQHPQTTRAGIVLYYAGAERMTAAGRVEYTRCLEPLLSAEELEAWRATSNENAAAWLRRYWSRKAAQAGVLPDERLAAHYRRLHRARIDFPNAAPLSVLQQQAVFALRQDSRRFGLSLRGLMLLRHGDPYRLAAIEDCLADPWPAAGSATICHEFGRSRSAVFRAMARRAQGDSYDPFVRNLTLLSGVYAFRGDRGVNDIVFAVGLPARSANALVEASGRMAGLLSAVLLTDSGAFIREDSAFSTAAPRSAHPLAGQTEAVTLLFGVLQAPAGNAEREYRVTVSDTRRHAGATRAGTVQLHDFRGFSLSDVVVAPAGMRVGWRRGGATVRFAPLATYRPGEAVSVYYEIYGLDEGAAYETEIELAPPAGGIGERLLDLLGRDRSVRFRFSGTAARGHPVYGVQEDRTLRLDGVEPGLWTLRVRVTDTATGQGVVREVPVEIEPG